MCLSCGFHERYVPEMSLLWYVDNKETFSSLLSVRVSSHLCTFLVKLTGVGQAKKKRLARLSTGEYRQIKEIGNGLVFVQSKKK
jgi:hypothetical protein